MTKDQFVDMIVGHVACAAADYFDDAESDNPTNLIPSKVDPESPEAIQLLEDFAIYLAETTDAHDMTN